jgi:hypothetical protein
MKTAKYLIVIGVIIQILTSMFWFHIPNIQIAEIVEALGQIVGEILYFIAFTRLFIEDKTFKYFLSFVRDLIIFDIFDILFLNPFEISTPKYSNFYFAIILLLYKLIRKFLKKEE